MKYTRNYKSIFNFKKLTNIPKYPVLVTFLIILTGVISLYSAGNGNIKLWALKHILHAGLGIFISIFVLTFDLKKLKSLSYLTFACSILVLLFVLLFGRKALGATRWINLGFITIQPSEVVKISLILTLARYYDNLKTFEINMFYMIFMPLILSIMLALPIMMQPDLTTGGILMLLSCSIVFFFIKDLRILMLPIGLALITLPIIWFKFLKQFQKMRILNFLDSNIDPLGSGYNLIQSKIAIGSGGLFGKGLLNGTQGQLKFIPEHHSDFIFSLISEEFGFGGVLFVFGLYFYIISYGYGVIKRVKTIFSKVIAIGCTNLLSLHVFINISMTCGMFPVAGIPLPMISSGGTMMIVSLICISLLINVDINKDISDN